MSVMRRRSRSADRSLRAQLARGFGLLVFLVLGFLGGTLVVYHAREEREEAGSRIVVAARNRAAALDEYVDDHVRAVSIVAATMPLRDGVVTTDVANEQLALAREMFPSFLTMIVASDAGIVVAANPLETESGESVLALNQSIADREYFVRAMASRKPFVSEAFRGRGFGSQPIIAVSAPIVSGSRVVAVVEGSLDLSAFSEFEKALTDIEGVSILIVDARARVIFGSGAHHRPALTNVEDAPIVIASNGSDREAYEYREPGLGEFIASAARTKQGWHVFVRQPTSIIVSELLRDSLVSILAILFATGLGFLFARWFASRVSRPLDVLVGAMSTLSEGPRKIDLDPPGDAPREVRMLMSGFTRMSADLAVTDRELRRLLAEEAVLRSDLEAERVELRSEVERRIEAQRKLEILNRELEQARDLALEGSRSKSAFLARMSHELRTPLNAILGFSGILEAKLQSATDPRLVEQARNVQTAGRKLLRLVDDLLAVAQLETGEVEIDPVECELAPLLRQAAETAERNAEAGHVRLDLDIPSDLGRATIDGAKLLQAIVALLGNAFKFTAEGSVWFRGRRECRGDSEELVVTISDTGIGIAEEKLRRVFEPFAQGDDSMSRRFGGAGLGLAIAQRLCHAMGGRIEVASEEGVGSVFVLSVPVGSGRGSSD